MKKTVSPNRSRSIAQSAAYIQKASNRYGTLLAKLFEGYSMKADVGELYSIAEVYAPNGEIIAAQTCGGAWIKIQTEAETKLIDTSTEVYAKAYSAAARTEMKANAQVQAQPNADTAVLDIRA